jgi:PhoH-like protein
MSHIDGAIRNEGLKYKALPTPDTSNALFKLHTLAAFIGPRGSGKTNAVVLLARRYLDDGSINRIFIISPTYESNRIFELLEPKPEDVFKNMHECLADIQTIIVRVKQMVEEYEHNKAYNEIYKRYKKFMNGKGPPLKTGEFNIVERFGFKKMEDIPRPSPLLIIDDMSHSDLYTPSKKNSFINLCLRHRHLFKVGLSIFMLVQTFKTGIPKCLRQNIQQFFLWPTHDMSQLESMYDEFANLCTKEDFMDMFKRATNSAHSFMSIDMNASDSLLRFRKCFDSILLPSHLLTEEELAELANERRVKKGSKRKKEEEEKEETKDA